MYTYLLIHVFTIIGPLFGSFERRVNFKSKWKYAVPAAIVVAIPFLIWDVIFTKWGVWGFNEAYYMGIKIAGLPVEEWLFFLTVPFACLLIYETVCTLRQNVQVSRRSFMVGAILGFSLIITSLIFIHQVYTFVAFLLTGLLLLVHALVLKKNYFSNFLIAYLIHLIPFFIVNGVLTALPVVWYDNTENFGIRMGSIPVEDAIYSMLLLLGNVTVYEQLCDRN